jgi:hypothetical protein
MRKRERNRNDRNTIIPHLPIPTPLFPWPCSLLRHTLRVSCIARQQPKHIQGVQGDGQGVVNLRDEVLKIVILIASVTN